DFLRTKNISGQQNVEAFVDAWNALPVEGKPVLKVADAKRINDLLVAPQEKPFNGETITMMVNDFIKEKMKSRAKGETLGTKKGIRLRDELVVKVRDLLKTNPNLSTRQAATILTKLKNTNLFSAGSVQELKIFTDKVVSDAEYAQKLGKAKQLGKKIKKLTRAKKDTSVTKQKSLKRFLAIDPAQVKDIDAYLDQAQGIVSKPQASEPGMFKPGRDLLVLEDYTKE